MYPLTKNDFEKLLEKDSSELKIAYKVTTLHLECKGSVRQRVRIAAQLLSHTIAKALTFIFGEKYKVQSDAIETINDWFDTMNSSTMCSKKKLSCGFGIHFEDQLYALNKMRKLILTMKIHGKSYMLPFQKGILISIEATQGLFKIMQENGLSFLLTTRVNQDNLENVFSRIRAMTGNHQHPSPVEALRRLRILMIGQDPPIEVDKAAVEKEPNEVDVNMYQDNATDENLATKIATSTIKDVPSNSDEPLFECEDSEI